MWRGAVEDIGKGQEVVHSYGDLGDAELLRVYGFLEGLDQAPGRQPHNPHNRLALAVATLQVCGRLMLWRACTSWARHACFCQLQSAVKKGAWCLQENEAGAIPLLSRSALA